MFVAISIASHRFSRARVANHPARLPTLPLVVEPRMKLLHACKFNSEAILYFPLAQSWGGSSWTSNALTSINSMSRDRRCWERQYLGASRVRSSTFWSCCSTSEHLGRCSVLNMFSPIQLQILAVLLLPWIDAFFQQTKYVSNFSVAFKDSFIFHVKAMSFYIHMKNKFSLLKMLYQFFVKHESWLLID